MSSSGLVAGDPAKQWEWHESYRDLFKNMYRTTYSDMSHGRETYVRSDYPAGYGGHIPSIRFDILHRNTAFDRNQALIRSDPSRDAMPSFKANLDGVPNYTKHPCGARKNPTKGVVPHDGTTTMLKPPWGVLTGKRDPLNYRAVPPTMKRAFSSPSIARSNDAARTAGSLMASGEGSVSAAQLDSRSLNFDESRQDTFSMLSRRVVSAKEVDAASSIGCWLARLAEKPTREFAEEHLVTSVLPEGLFLTSFGQYVLTPSVFRALRSSKAGHFTEALDQLRQSEGVFGVLIEGMRWDLGTMQTYVQCLQAQAQDDAEPPAKRSRAV